MGSGRYCGALTWRAKLDAVLQGAHKVAVAQLDDVQAVGLLHVLHPLVGLALRVDHQGPAASVAARTKIGRRRKKKKRRDGEKKKR